MKRILIPLSMALVFGLASAQEETEMAYSDFDTDASGDVSYEEFSAGYGAESSRYSDFDADASGGVDQDEFTSGLYRSSDENGDQALTEDEFNAGTSTFYGEEYEGAAYSELDADASGDVSEEEFTTGFDASSTYSEFDADASGDVNEEEFTQGIYNTADADDAGALTEDEFNNASGLFGDDQMMEGTDTEEGITEEGEEEGEEGE